MASFDKAIPPGGVGKITLQVNTSSYQGQVRKSAFVHSNDPALPKTAIFLSMNVRPYVEVQPSPRIYLSGVAGDEMRQVLHLRSSDDKPLEISRIETNIGSSLGYKLNRTKEGDEYELEVFSKVAKSDLVRGYLKLFTNHPKKPVLELPVRIQVKPEFEVWPKSVIFRWTPEGGAQRGDLKRRVILVNNRKEGFRLRDLQYNKEYFEVRILGQADQPASKHQLEVVAILSKLPVDEPKVQDTLIIKTDVPEAGELKVPMSILKRNERIFPPRGS